MMIPLHIVKDQNLEYPNGLCILVLNIVLSLTKIKPLMSIRLIHIHIRHYSLSEESHNCNIPLNDWTYPSEFENFEKERKQIATDLTAMILRITIMHL